MSMVATSKKNYHILVIDDDSTIRDNLRQYLSLYHQRDYDLTVDEASTAEEALEKLHQHQFDLVISDINLPDKNGFHILREAIENHPNIKRALITAYDCDTYIPKAQEEKVYNIIIKSAPFHFQELSNLVDNLLEPEKSFGLHKYLDDKSPEDLNQVVIQSSHQIMTTYDALKNFFKSLEVPDVDAVGIVMVEAITNAVYYAPRLEDGSYKYQKGDVIDRLEPHEEVIVTYGADEEKAAVSILDQGGRLTADEILYWLNRNVSGEALTDTHGRGIFLIHRLMDRVIINVAKGQQTELILMRFLDEPAAPNKPIFINEYTP